MKKVALISTPWPLFNRPSIQLGTLKAFVRENLPDVEIDLFHVYLDIANSLGFKIYKEISMKTWLSEAPYAMLLFPELSDGIEMFWQRNIRKSAFLQGVNFKELCKDILKITDAFIESVKWHEYEIAGFSISFAQLCSTLFFIKRIKKRQPDIKIVIGGPGCSGEVGFSILRNFKEIDFLINGEGEIPLLELIKWIKNKDDSIPHIPGLITRNTPKYPSEAFSQIDNLDDLPIPDYEDYFEQLKRIPPERSFFPSIPIEVSRGCWWKSRWKDAAGGCSFCNLNLQWRGYRQKSPDKLIKELNHLSTKYQSLSFSFVDNLLPRNGLTLLAEKIKNLRKDFNLFGELRAKTRYHELLALGRAGFSNIQVGIEALSTRLLNKMKKGTRAIDNLEIMKNCESPELPDLNGNIIVQFPGSDEEDVKETLRNLRFAMNFKPLKAIPFMLEYGSPVFQRPSDFGITRIYNHNFYRQMFPEYLFKSLKFMILSYHEKRGYQAKLWAQVVRKVKEWENYYHKMHQRPKSPPILYFQDGGDFLIIHQRRLNKDDMVHRLKGTSRKIYLFCQQTRSIKEILKKHPRLTEDHLLPFLRMMMDKGLMFNEGSSFLSLAVPWKSRVI